MTTLVVDASVVIKWVVQERGSDDAVRLLDGPTLVAPDLLVPECANILWKKVHRGELSREEATAAAELLMRADIEPVPTRALMALALRLALDLDHAAYDGTYLALAVDRDISFITADVRFARLVAEKGTPDVVGRVVVLAELAGVLP